TRSEFVRGLILGSDGTKARITAASPSQPEHQSKRGDGNYERTVAAKVEEKARERCRLVNSSFVEGDGNREAFVDAQGTGGADINASASDLGGGIAAGSAIGAGENIGAKVRCAIRQDDMCARVRDGNWPLVASNVPVELIVIVEEAE